MLYLHFFTSHSIADEYTFGQCAADFGLGEDSVYFSANSIGITSLEGLANNYHNLTIVDLAYNQLSSIESYQFVGHSNLLYLNLYDNLISSIESNSFHGLDNLNDLSLSSNQISTLNSNAL